MTLALATRNDGEQTDGESGHDRQPERKRQDVAVDMDLAKPREDMWAAASAAR